MSETAGSLYDIADLAFKRGQWEQAIAAFGGVTKVCPRHFKTRFRIADCLLNMGKRAEALEVYKALAWHATKMGYPLQGLIAVKMVLLLEPSYEDVLVVLSELYAKDSDRVDPSHPGVETPQLKPVEAAALDGDEAIEEAARLAAHIEEPEQYPESLPPIPLFSHLDDDAFVDVLAKLRLRRFADEEPIVRQGERGESFYIVADGDVVIKRDVDDDGGVTLAHLHRGAVFGEMALISDDARQASVFARGDVDILEMRRSDLIVAAAHLSSVTQALKDFTRERFLGNLTATHPLFSALSREERHVVMEQFTPVSFDAGDTLIREGDQGEGLFLLLAGSAEVSKVSSGDVSSGDRVHLANIKGGDLCGEMSLVGNNQTTATVSARERVEALFLSRDAFQRVISEHPELMKYLASLTDERLRQNRALLLAKGLFEDDEHVMI